jgi:hypothetical protein
MQDIAVILERAKQRGEIERNQFSESILSLPVVLLQNGVLFPGTSSSRFSVIEIVDEIFIPLVTK